MAYVFVDVFLDVFMAVSCQLHLLTVITLLRACFSCVDCCLSLFVCVSVCVFVVSVLFAGFSDVLSCFVYGLFSFWGMVFLLLVLFCLSLCVWLSCCFLFMISS